MSIDVGLSYNPFTREWEVWRSDEAVDALAAKMKKSTVEES